MEFVVTKPRPKEVRGKANQEEPQYWAVSPIRGDGRNKERPNHGLQKLQLAGAIPPVIKVEGRLVVQRQKIAILTQDEITALKSARIGKRSIAVRVVRVSDCPNPIGEYGQLTYTVLLEFDELKARRIARSRFYREDVTIETEQSNNFILSGNPPPRAPSPPVQDDALPTQIGDSDFQSADDTDIEQYPEGSRVVVAVVDSGAKFDLANRPDSGLYEYTDRKGVRRKLRLVRGKPVCGIQQPNIGYCGIGTYLTPASPLPASLQVLSSLSQAQVAASAFDDATYRHGTYVTAIINQESDEAVGALPVKAFNWAGFCTLFDVLATLNYVLEQKRQGVPIYVLNASWVGSVDEEGRTLLLSKFRELEKAGILVIAAAGNQGRDLGRLILYPACFSTELTNVITVTSVEPTFRPVLLKTVGDPISDLMASDGKDNILEYLGLNTGLFDLFLRGYKTVGNYSTKFVSVGVFGRRWFGYNSPFHGEQHLMANTSYAAAYMSGQVATYLLEKEITPVGGDMTSLRDAILQDLATNEQSLSRTIQHGRLVKVKP